jgi:hypothetical protein
MWTVRVVTLAIAVLAFAAIDDVTTDTADTFVVEYTFLAASAAWLVFLTVRWVRQRRRAG